MNLRTMQEHRSWLIAFGVTVLIALWLLSGAFVQDDEKEPQAATTVGPAGGR